MKKKVTKSMAVILAVAAIAGSSLTAHAAPAVMPDGTTFDAEFYAANNPDVVAAYGTDAAALYQHYVDYGKAEGRKPVSNTVTDQKALDNAAAAHNYYKGVTKEQAASADAVAQQIAESIMSNTAYTTDLQRVTAAAQAVASYCNNSVYGADANKYYRSPYGVFVAGVYTCAGSTRALGRVLDYMGYSWQHVNENKWVHQWCVLDMDGQAGFADGMGSCAGYGEMVSGMTLPDGRTIYFPT